MNDRDSRVRWRDRGPIRDITRGMAFSMAICCLALLENWGVQGREIVNCVGTFAILGLSIGLLSTLKRFLHRKALDCKG